MGKTIKMMRHGTLLLNPLKILSLHLLVSVLRRFVELHTYIFVGKILLVYVMLIEVVRVLVIETVAERGCARIMSVTEIRRDRR